MIYFPKVKIYRLVMFGVIQNTLHFRAKTDKIVSVGIVKVYGNIVDAGRNRC